jgi:membrane protein required for colicin V production
MNWLDIIIIVVLLASLLGGLFQGFVRTLFSLVGTIVGVLLASHYYTQLAGVLKFISNPGVANIVAFVIILLAVLIAAAIIGSVLKSVLAAIKLGCIDRIAGAALGFILGALFISAILAGIVKFFGESAVTESAIARILLDKFPIILGLLPGQFDNIRDFFR